MRQKLLLLVGLALLASCDSTPNFTHDDSSDLEDNLNRLADSFIDRGIPGMVLLIDDPSTGVTIVESGVADLDTKEALTKEHLFHSASLMKVYTAVCIFILEEAGELNLTDNIDQHLAAEIIAKIPNGGEARVIDLLRHRSGIPDFAEQPNYLQELIAHTEGGPEPDNVLDYIKDLNPEFPAGTADKYSNTGPYLLSKIVEALSGELFEDYLQREVIDALNLENTFYRNRPSAPDYTRVPEYYIDWDGNGRLTNSTQLENIATSTFEGFSGLLATIEDFHAFIKALFVDRRLLSEASLETMMSVSHDQGFGFGAGVEVILSTSFPGKYGHKGGTQSSFFYYPERELIVISMLNYSFNDGRSPFDRMAIARDEIGVDGNLVGEVELCLFE